MPTKHLRYGGSTMARTINCPAWVNISADIPHSNNSSPAAEEGTALHDAMEWLYTSGEGLAGGVGGLIHREFNGIIIDHEHLENKLKPANTAIDTLMDTYNVKDYVLEPFVELIPDLAGGSIDFLGISKDGATAVVADYKFGFNGVDPENPQLLFYALCADADPTTTEMFKYVETLVLAIIQPNDKGEDTLKTWVVPIGTLDAFEQKVADAIAKAEGGDMEPCPGSWCKFCPAEAICPAKTGVARQAARLPAIHAEALAEYLPMADELEAWIKAVRKMAHEQLDLGTKIEGYKLVNKRASRVWTDAPAVEKKIKNMRGVRGTDQYEMKLKSPAQMEKLFKQKGVDFEKVADYITSVSSGTTLAKASDKRPEAPSVGAFKAALSSLPE